MENTEFYFSKRKGSFFFGLGTSAQRKCSLFGFPTNKLDMKLDEATTITTVQPFLSCVGRIELVLLFFSS